MASVAAFFTICLINSESVLPGRNIEWSIRRHVRPPALSQQSGRDSGYGLKLADVLNHRFAPAIDVRPGAVADTVAGAGYVDHVSLAARRGDTVVRLLVGD